MRPRPRISVENRAKIVILAEEGYSQRAIASRVGCSQRSVCEIIKKHTETGEVRDRKIPGRPRKTTSREDRLIVRKSMTDRFKTAPQIKSELSSSHNLILSTSTTQRRLREAGLYGRKARKKPRLTLSHKRARFLFARQHKDWTEEEWARVLFSDESRFCLFRSDGRAYVRRLAGEEFAEHCLMETVKHGGGGVMVWGCISSKGVGHLKKVSGRLNAVGYIDVLENTMIPSTHGLLMGNNWIFQQDNAPCHTARSVMEWFDNEGIEVLKWPAQSPDLNPIENLWDQVATRVHEQNPSNLNELWVAVQSAWNSMAAHNIKFLINSMPRRCEAVIKAKGGATRY